MYIFSYFLEVLCLSVSLGKRPYWCIYESKALLLVGAKSSWLVIHLNDACFPLHLLLNTYWKKRKRKRKRKDIDVCTVCVSSLHILLMLSILLSFFAADILLFLCGEEVVTQQCLLKVWFLTIGFISYMLFLLSFIYVLSKFHFAL